MRQCKPTTSKSCHVTLLCLDFRSTTSLDNSRGYIVGASTPCTATVPSLGMAECHERETGRSLVTQEVSMQTLVIEKCAGFVSTLSLCFTVTPTRVISEGKSVPPRFFVQVYACESFRQLVHVSGHDVTNVWWWQGHWGASRRRGISRAMCVSVITSVHSRVMTHTFASSTTR